MFLSKLTKKYFRTFFYSLSVTLGIYIALQELHQNQSINRFILFSLLVLFIYVVEIFSHWRTKSSKVEINLDFDDEINELSHLFHKLILPIGLYFSIVGFGFYNLRSSSLIFLLIAVFVTFFILFVNIRAFFDHKLRAQDKTHYVYDLIKFLIFFCLADVFSNAANNFTDNLVLYAASMIAVTFSLIVLMLWRYDKVHLYSLVYGSIASVFIGIIFFLYHIDRVVNSLQISLGLFFIFYLTSAIIHHLVMKTFSRGVLTEYVLVILIVIAVTYGIA